MFDRFTEKDWWGHNAWWRRNKDKVAFVIVYLIIVAVVLIIFFSMIVRNDAVEACYAAGYSEMHKVGGGGYYCYRFVDGTEEIVPLKDVGQ